MKTRHNTLVLLAFCAGLVTPAVRAQGPLTPPGAPAPGMKTLAQVEPRTAITNAGCVVAQPGSYYLTGNLTASGGVALITVQADDVTLDLNGFAILGATGSAAGIFVDGARNVVVRNGTIRDCYLDGIDSGSAAQCLFEELRLYGNSRIGTGNANVWAGNETRVLNCWVAESHGYGVIVRDRSEVRGCTVRGNAEHGIVAHIGSHILGNVVTDNDIGLKLSGPDNVVAENRVYGNADNYDFAAGNQLSLLLSEIPETLDWPCSVTLAGTLSTSLTATNGITVNADNVTIDLAGHALVGPGASSGHGIYQHADRRNLEVRNGKVTKWQGYNKGGLFLSGINMVVEGIEAQTNDCGILVRQNASLRGCVATGNGNYGISAGDGNTLENCAASENRFNGITCWTGNTLENCAAYENGGTGIVPLGGNTLQNCAVCNNAEHGISAGYGNTLQNCTAIANGNDGISAASDNTLQNCTVFNNGYSTDDGAGIHVTGNDNRIESNNCTDNGRGIRVDASGNFIARNTCSGNTTNWVVVAGNVCLVVQAATGGAISGNSGGAAPGSTDPNANFTY